MSMSDMERQEQRWADANPGIQANLAAIEGEKLLHIYRSAANYSTWVDDYQRLHRVDFSGDAECAYGEFSHDLDAAVGKLKEALERMEVL